ncbi:hypothetical protein HDU92_006748 [Lobulomyces angularis]|nr:hypothetical protein HDU92_006748 [Lobulomyces angularis]
MPEMTSQKKTEAEEQSDSVSMTYEEENNWNDKVGSNAIPGTQLHNEKKTSANKHCCTEVKPPELKVAENIFSCMEKIKKKYVSLEENSEYETLNDVIGKEIQMLFSEGKLRITIEPQLNIENCVTCGNNARDPELEKYIEDIEKSFHIGTLREECEAFKSKVAAISLIVGIINFDLWLTFKMNLVSDY